jgi:hypothetical protein
MLNLRFGDQRRISQAMRFYFEHKLVGDIVKEYPGTSEVMERYFGKGCLKRGGFKIKTLGTACILFDANPNRLIQEFGKIQN